MDLCSFDNDLKQITHRYYGRIKCLLTVKIVIFLRVSRLLRTLNWSYNLQTSGATSNTKYMSGRSTIYIRRYLAPELRILVPTNMRCSKSAINTHAGL